MDNITLKTLKNIYFYIFIYYKNLFNLSPLKNRHTHTWLIITLQKAWPNNNFKTSNKTPTNIHMEKKYPSTTIRIHHHHHHHITITRIVVIINKNYKRIIKTCRVKVWQCLIIMKMSRSELPLIQNTIVFSVKMTTKLVSSWGKATLSKYPTHKKSISTTTFIILLYFRFPFFRHSHWLKILTPTFFNEIFA